MQTSLYASKVINVLLVDDHEIVRAGFSRLLAMDSRLSIVAEVGSGEAAIAALNAFSIDIVVMDINMETMSGIDAARIIKTLQPAIKLIMLSIHETEPFVSQCLSAGASAFLSKRCAPDELQDSIYAVYHGGQYISAHVAHNMEQNKNNNAENKLSQLTSREYEIFSLLAQGYSPDEVARDLTISRKTVYVHRDNIYQKLNTKNFIELKNFAKTVGVIG